jgi:hypothetical protein
VKWISVKEQKPEVDKKVLGYSGGDEVEMVYFDGGWFMGTDGCRNKFVNHWMEIPYPPPQEPVDRETYWPESERFQLGTKVITTEDAGGKDWVISPHNNRLWGEVGIIMDRSDAHGLCYQVRYVDGERGWFEPEELELTLLNCYIGE